MDGCKRPQNACFTRVPRSPRPICWRGCNHRVIALVAMRCCPSAQSASGVLVPSEGHGNGDCVTHQRYPEGDIEITIYFSTHLFVSRHDSQPIMAREKRIHPKTTCEMRNARGNPSVNFSPSDPVRGYLSFFLWVSVGEAGPESHTHIFKSAFPYPLEIKSSPYY